MSQALMMVLEEKQGSVSVDTIILYWPILAKPIDVSQPPDKCGILSTLQKSARPELCLKLCHVIVLVQKPLYLSLGDEMGLVFLERKSTRVKWDFL